MHMTDSISIKKWKQIFGDFVIIVDLIAHLVLRLRSERSMRL